MSKQTKADFAPRAAYRIEPQNYTNGPDDLPGVPRPLSLSAGPVLTWLNAIGDEEAQAIVAEWRPRFTVTVVSKISGDSWQ